MAKKYLCGIDLVKTELLNARIQNLSTAPPSPLDGLIYYNTTDHRLYYYANGTWVDTSSSGGEVFTTELKNKLNASTNENTISTIVMRDASGNFTASTITANLVGNASTANKLKNPRSISITGAGTGTVPFDGDTDVTINLSLADSGASAGTFPKVTVNAKGLVTGGSSLTVSDIPTLTLSKISDAGTAASKNVGTSAGNVPILGAGGKLDTSILPALAINDTFPVSSQEEMLALTAQRGDIAIRSDSKANYILAVDDPTVLANWKPLVTPTNAVTSVAGRQGTVTLSKADVGLDLVDNTSDADKAVLSATKLATARAIALSGDIAGTANFDGSGGVSIISTLATVATAGTYKSVTVDAKGRVTSGTNPTTLAGFGITDAIKKYTTLVGDGLATSHLITHNLNSRSVVVSLHETSAPYSEVFTDVLKGTENTLTLLFASAPSVDQYTVTVVG